MKDVSLKRLKDCMKRAEEGEELTIGFLGGSITQGSLIVCLRGGSRRSQKQTFIM